MKLNREQRHFIIKKQFAKRHNIFLVNIQLNQSLHIDKLLEKGASDEDLEIYASRVEKRVLQDKKYQAQLEASLLDHSDRIESSLERLVWLLDGNGFEVTEEEIITTLADNDLLTFDSFVEVGVDRDSLIEVN